MDLEEGTEPDNDNFELACATNRRFRLERADAPHRIKTTVIIPCVRILNCELRYHAGLHIRCL